MFVRVGSDGAVSLQEPDDLARFHVEVPSGISTEAAARALCSAGAGAAHGDVAGEAAVVVSPDWIRAHAVDGAGAGWDEAFDGMLAYAASKGWIAADGRIRAHVVEAE